MEFCFHFWQSNSCTDPILSSLILSYLILSWLHKYERLSESYPDLLWSLCAHVLSVQLQVRYSSRAMCVSVRVCMRGRERLSAACSVLNHRWADTPLSLLMSLFFLPSPFFLLLSPLFSSSLYLKNMHLLSVLTGRLHLSDRAHIVFDFHQAIDGLNEAKLGDKKLGEKWTNTAIFCLCGRVSRKCLRFPSVTWYHRIPLTLPPPIPLTPGTTHKGIGPAYSSKTMRNGIRIGDLRDMEFFETRLRGLVKQLEGASVCGVVLCVHLSI